MREIRGAIFDVDGLLFNTEQLYCDICIELAPNYGIETYDEAYYKQYLGTSNQDLYRIYGHDFPFLTTQDIEHFVSAVQSRAEKALLAGEVDIKTGAKALLEFLSEKNIACVIASNNYTRFIDAMIRHHGIHHHFDHIYSLDDVENPKPHPEIVHKSLMFLDADPKEVIMFEDSTHGASAAIAANVPVIVVPDMMPPAQEIRAQLLQECESLEHAQVYLSRTYLF